MNTDLYPSEKKMKRPIGVTVIAVWCFVGSASALIFSVVQFIDADIDLLPQPFLLSASAVSMALCIGLWKMKNWARIATAMATAVSLLASLLFYILSPFLLDLSLGGAALEAVTYILNLGIVIYLLRPRVKEAFLLSVRARPAASPQTQPPA